MRELLTVIQRDAYGSAEDRKKDLVRDEPNLHDPPLSVGWDNDIASTLVALTQCNAWYKILSVEFLDKPHS
jgi:hypothetical protein